MKSVTTVFRSFVCSIFLIASWLIVTPENAAGKTISDHRVKNLSCQNVNANSVAHALRPEIFQTAHHLPFANWSFSYGLYDLGACWSLSRFQRLYFYLREPGATTTMTDFSNQARAADMYDDEQGWRTFPMRQFWFMPETSDRRWSAWEQGWTEPGTRQPAGLDRGRKPDLEIYQATRLLQIDNLRLLKGPLARTIGENRATYRDLALLVANGRKPLIVLRPDKYLQHVVVVKDAGRTSTGTTFHVYDSNHPTKDGTVIWDAATAMFTAYDIVDDLAIANPSAPVGVFIVDQDENETILQALAGYYKGLCAR